MHVPVRKSLNFFLTKCEHASSQAPVGFPLPFSSRLEEWTPKHMVRDDGQLHKYI